jgi:membrane associated rhomboid family serine protease
MNASSVSVPWDAHDLLPENPHNDSWATFEEGEARPASLDTLHARIAIGPGKVQWNGQQEHKEFVLVAAPGQSRFIPLPECVELRESVVANQQLHLKAARNKSAWFFFPLLFICVVMALANNGHVAILPALFAVTNGTTFFESCVRLSKLDAHPDRYLAHWAAQLRFDVWTSRQASKGWPRTLGMVGVWVVIGIVQIAVVKLGPDATPRADLAAAALIKSNVWAEPWRLLTGTMLHGSFMHLLMNALAALSFSTLLEGAANRRYVAVVWLAGALAGSLLSWAATSTTSVGASGGIMAWIGFLLAMAYRRRSTLPPDFFHSMLRSVMWIAVFGILAWESIDNAAHLGGLITGAVMGGFIFRASNESLPIRDTKANAMMGLVCEAVFVVLAAFTLFRLVWTALQ